MSALQTFVSYARDDREFLAALVKHLAMLTNDGLLSIWTDRDIHAGEEFDAVIDKQLEAAELVLLLVSDSFMASDYCYRKEMSAALARHHMGQCLVVPIILRPCDWETAPFARLQALPTGGKAVTDRDVWHDNDQALADVARGLRRAVTRVGAEGAVKDMATGPTRSNGPDLAAAAVEASMHRLSGQGGSLGAPEMFQTVVVPLMKEFENLHAQYLDSFRSCRRLLEERGDTPEGYWAALDRLESDTLFRASQLTRVQEMSDGHTSAGDEAFIRAVTLYLNAPSQLVSFAGQRMGRPVSLRTNWYGVAAHASVEAAAAGSDPAARKALALKAVDGVVRMVQERYADVFHVYRKLSEASRSTG